MTRIATSRSFSIHFGSSRSLETSIMILLRKGNARLHSSALMLNNIDSQTQSTRYTCQPHQDDNTQPAEPLNWQSSYSTCITMFYRHLKSQKMDLFYTKDIGINWLFPASLLSFPHRISGVIFFNHTKYEGYFEFSLHIYPLGPPDSAPIMGPLPMDSYQKFASRPDVYLTPLARHFCLHARTGSFLFWIVFHIFLNSTRATSWLRLSFLGQWRSGVFISYFKDHIMNDGIGLGTSVYHSCIWKVVFLGMWRLCWKY